MGASAAWATAPTSSEKNGSDSAPTRPCGVGMTTDRMRSASPNGPQVAAAAERLSLEAHVQLVETLAARIIAWAFVEDARVESVRVSIRKPQALLKADAAGVFMEADRDGFTEA